MSHWTKEWTIETVEGNYSAIGCIDPEDVHQLLQDAKVLHLIKEYGNFNILEDLIKDAESTKRILKELGCDN